MIKKKYNKTLKLLFLLLALTSGIEQCFSASVSGNAMTESSSDQPKGEQEKIIGVDRYIVRYKFGVSVSKTIEMNALDLKGQSLIPNDISETQDDSFNAGTWVGINVTENQTSSWKINADSLEYYLTKKTARCKYTKYICYPVYETPYENKIMVDLSSCSGCIDTVPQGGDYNCKCPGEKQIVPGLCAPASYTDTRYIEKEWGWEEEEYTCPVPYPHEDGWTYEGTVEYGIKEISVGSIEELEEQAINEVKRQARNSLGNPTANVNYIKVNDYPINEQECNQNLDSCYGTLSNEAGELKTRLEERYQGMYEKDFQFIQQNVCIDVRTADITYGRNCTENELQVKNIENGDRTYWKYFIPLNAKSSDKFWLQVIANNTVSFNKDQCISIMKNRTNYQNYIAPLSNVGTMFDGKYLEYLDNPSEENENDYKTVVTGGGCLLSVTIDFPIVQRFYNEIDASGTKKFKGFNFYYKPIDINNPFPNGLTGDDNLWKDWYTNYQSGNEVKPNISKSYDNVSYIASIPNPSVIRNYNKNNPYTDWSNIGLDGRSSFIGSGVESLGVITRQNDTLYPVHKLGCGKSNTDPSNSIMYMEECGDAS